MDADASRPENRPGAYEDSPGRAYGAAPNGHDKTSEAPADAFRAAGHRLREIQDYIGYYVSARLDTAKAGVRTAVLYAVLGAIGLLVAIGVVLTATVVLVLGLALAISALLGLWAGFLITGALLLGLIVGGTWFAISRMTRSARERTVRKYEQRRREQRAQFGHDVHERAEEARQ